MTTNPTAAYDPETDLIKVTLLMSPGLLRRLPSCERNELEATFGRLVVAAAKELIRRTEGEP